VNDDSVYNADQLINATFNVEAGYQQIDNPYFVPVRVKVNLVTNSAKYQSNLLVPLARGRRGGRPPVDATSPARGLEGGVGAPGDGCFRNHAHFAPLALR
jgi:hypothetical protein